jgi:hypothetical protein
VRAIVAMWRFLMNWRRVFSLHSYHNFRSAKEIVERAQIATAKKNIAAFFLLPYNEASSFSSLSIS